jgi:hypothetical protein
MGVSAAGRVSVTVTAAVVLALVPTLAFVAVKV